LLAQVRDIPRHCLKPVSATLLAAHGDTVLGKPGNRLLRDAEKLRETPCGDRLVVHATSLSPPLNPCQRRVEKLGKLAGGDLVYAMTIVQSLAINGTRLLG
jgi:hypothetical protein